MKRDVWLVCISVFLALGLVVAGCAKAPAAAEPIKLRFALWAPEMSPNVWHTAVPWKKVIEERTKGRVEIVLFTAGGLGPMEELYENCLAGVCDIFEYGQMPQFEFTQLAGLSYLFPSATVASVVANELAHRYFQKYDYPGVKVLWMISNAPANVIASTEKCGPIRTLEDRKGKKTMAPSLYAVRTAKAVGASPVGIPIVEAYSALERGMLDYWLSNADAMWTFKIAYVTKYRTVMPQGAGTFTMGIMMNQDKFNKLPPDIQQIIEEESGEKWSAISGQGMELADQRSWTKILEYDKKVENPEPYYMTDEECLKTIKAITPVNEEFMNELAAKGYPAREAMAELLRLVEVYSKKYPPQK
jgi:TRAP-type C4-dicarboxylate transport system substrate-binding protein